MIKTLLVLCLFATCSAWRVLQTCVSNKVQATKIASAGAAAALSLGLGLGLGVAPVFAQVQDSVFVGQYNDPNHPGCLRKISSAGKDITIVGSDEIDGTKQWLLKATEDYPGTIFVDFSPKGGPPDLLGVYNEKAGEIKWPDGNAWTKLSAQKSK